MNIKGI